MTGIVNWSAARYAVRVPPPLTLMTIPSLWSPPPSQSQDLSCYLLPIKVNIYGLASSCLGGRCYAPAALATWTTGNTKTFYYTHYYSYQFHLTGNGTSYQDTWAAAAGRQQEACLDNVPKLSKERTRSEDLRGISFN